MKIAYKEGSSVGQNFASTHAYNKLNGDIVASIEIKRNVYVKTKLPECETITVEFSGEEFDRRKLIDSWKAQVDKWYRAQIQPNRAVKLAIKAVRFLYGHTIADVTKVYSLEEFQKIVDKESSFSSVSFIEIEYDIQYENEAIKSVKTKLELSKNSSNADINLTNKLIAYLEDKEEIIITIVDSLS